MLTLDTQEQQFLERNVRKKIVLLQALPERERTKIAKEIKTWISLHKKLAKATDQLKTTRPELRLLQTLVLERLAVVLGKVLPAYEERVKKYPEVKPYLEKAEDLKEGLIGLSGKIGELL